MNISFNITGTHILLVLAVLWFFGVVNFDLHKITNRNNVCIKGYTYVIKNGEAKPTIKDGKYVECKK